MSARLKVTEQKYNTIVAQLKKNKGKKIAALHRLSDATISYIKNSTSYEDYLGSRRQQVEKSKKKRLQDAERQRLNDEFQQEAAQETRGWFHWLRKGN